MINVIEMGGEYDCTSAEELLEKLSPRHRFWSPSPDAWLFRGQQADLPLKAKAYRGEHVFEPFGIELSDPEVGFPQQVRYTSALELLLIRFKESVGRAGLPIPTGSPSLSRSEIDEAQLRDDDRASQANGLFLSTQSTPLLALAQHFGLPTPLLDWSTRSYVGAYFALPSEEPASDRLVIWALNSMNLDFTANTIALDTGALMTIETAPRASNPNLHAQSGVFTYIQGNDAYDYTVDAYMTELAATSKGTARTTPMVFPMMRKLTLPASCARRLRRLLFHEGIDGASMFLGYDGVVKSMQEHAMWD
jgi:hypothetical protein